MENQESNNNNQPMEGLDNDIFVTEQIVPRPTQPQNRAFRQILPSQYVMGYNKAGIPNSRLIVLEENDTCRKYSPGGHGFWFCLDCYQWHNLKALGKLNGSIFEAPVFHLCKPESREGAMEEQETIKQENKIATINTFSTHDILSNGKFADVILVASDGEEISTYRVLLSKYSDVFDKIFNEAAELPVRIIEDDSDAETIKDVISFFYGNADRIRGKELKIFNFAKKYEIIALKDLCIFSFMHFVDSGSVCDVIQLAYSNNLEQLKQKCLHVLIEKKKDIDPALWKALPREILADAFTIS